MPRSPPTEVKRSIRSMCSSESGSLVILSASSYESWPIFSCNALANWDMLASRNRVSKSGASRVVIAALAPSRRKTRLASRLSRIWGNLRTELKGNSFLSSTHRLKSLSLKPAWKIACLIPGFCSSMKALNHTFTLNIYKKNFIDIIIICGSKKDCLIKNNRGVKKKLTPFFI